MTPGSKLGNLKCTICHKDSDDDGDWVALLPCGHLCHLACLAKYIKIYNEELRQAEPASAGTRLSSLINYHEYTYVYLACGVSPDTIVREGRLPARASLFDDASNMRAGFVTLKIQSPSSDSDDTPSHSTCCGKTCQEDKAILRKELDDAKVEIAVLQKRLEAKEDMTKLETASTKLYEKIISRSALQQVQSLPASPLSNVTASSHPGRIPLSAKSPSSIAELTESWKATSFIGSQSKSAAHPCASPTLNKPGTNGATQSSTSAGSSTPGYNPLTEISLSSSKNTGSSATGTRLPAAPTKTASIPGNLADELVRAGSPSGDRSRQAACTPSKSVETESETSTDTASIASNEGPTNMPRRSQWFFAESYSSKTLR